MSPSPWTVHKFGGTSLADAHCLRHAAHLLHRRPEPRVAVVVSASAGTTNALLALTAAAAGGERSLQPALEELTHRQHELFRHLPEARRRPLTAALTRDLQTLRALLRTTGNTSFRQTLTARVAGFGEEWSARALTAHLRSLGAGAAWLDARDVLVVDPETGLESSGNGVDPERSAAALAAALPDPVPRFLVVTGFVASTADGRPTTLGRNGSDYSAALVATLLGARELTLWSDVDGILSADPSRLAGGRRIPELSYDEAASLAELGRVVLHPRPLGPASAHGLHLELRNTFHPDRPGTHIHRHAGGGCKGVATTTGIARVETEGTQESRSGGAPPPTGLVSVIGRDMPARGRQLRSLLVSAGLTPSHDGPCRRHASWRAVLPAAQLPAALRRLHDELFGSITPAAMPHRTPEAAVAIHAGP